MATLKIDIKTASIFDLTENEKLIEEVIGFLPDREEYEAYSDEGSKAAHMLDYAEHVHDKELISQINEAFYEKLATLFNE